MFIYEKIATKKYKVTCTDCGNVKYTTYISKKELKCNALTCGEQYYRHNYIGKTFGDMTILSKEDDNFVIKCNICGFVTKVRTSNFINNTFNNQSHQNCHKILYKQIKNLEKFQNFKERWRMMLRRCYDKKHKSYDIYNKYGVCEEWKDFMFFYKDMYETFEVELQLDRIDGKKGYSKENCRWVPPKINFLNRKTTKQAIAYNIQTNQKYMLGQVSTMSIREFSEKINISSTNIYNRLKKKMPNKPQKNYIFFNNEKELNEYLQNNYPSVESKRDL